MESLHCLIYSPLRDRRPGRHPSTTRYPRDSPAIGRPAGCLRSTPHHGGRNCRGRPRRTRGHFAPVGVRRSRRAGLGRPAPPHPAGRVIGAFRGPRRRQPPSPHLSRLRSPRRCRVRIGCGALSLDNGRQGLRNRRGRGRVLGTMSGVRLPGPRGCRARFRRATRPAALGRAHRRPDAHRAGPRRHPPTVTSGLQLPPSVEVHVP
jgi:hypothetical protein